MNEFEERENGIIGGFWKNRNPRERERGQRNNDVCFFLSFSKVYEEGGGGTALSEN